MPEKAATNVDAASITKQLLATLGASEVEKIARQSRWLRRLRDITPLALVVACMSTLGASKATWIADILRTFNAFTGLSIRYKPFHNQLRKEAFPEFMRRLVERSLDTMTRPILTPELGKQGCPVPRYPGARRMFVCAEGRPQGPVARTVYEDLAGRR
jgi:hypothetical protein